MAIEQKGFFKVPNGTTVYNGHCHGAVTLTSVSERLPVKLSSPVLTTQVCSDRESIPCLPHARWSHRCGSMPYNVANGDVWFGILAGWKYDIWLSYILTKYVNISLEGGQLSLLPIYDVVIFYSIRKENIQILYRNKDYIFIAVLERSMETTWYRFRIQSILIIEWIARTNSETFTPE